MEVSEDDQAKKNEFKVPLLHRQHFPIFENFKPKEGLKSLVLNLSFANFIIQNRQNMFLAILDKVTFILHFQEEDNPCSEENERAKRVITFSIFGLDALQESQKNILIRHIYKSQIPNTIKQISNTLMRNNNNLLTKSIYDFIFNSQNKKIYRYNLPSQIPQLYHYMVFMKQTLEKIFYAFTVQ